MELSLSHSSNYLMRISRVNAKCKTTSFSQYLRANIPINRQTNNRFSDYFSFKCSDALPSFRRNSIWASSQSQKGADGSDPKLIINKQSKFIDACWNFMRPYSLYGNVAVSVSLVTRSWIIENPDLITWSLLLKACSGLLALIFLNGYISGINQIYDIDIDKINKPYLPIVAGELSVESAWLLVIFYAVTGLFTVGLNGGLFLTCLYSLALFLGTAYSVPPFRLKRFAFGAMFTIVSARGFLLHYGVSYTARAALGLTFQWTAPLVFITIKASVFVLVMSFVKDLSDVEGDRKHQISTLPIKFGVRNIAFLGSSILLVKYIVGVLLASIYMPQVW
ncbi:hypothetical protein Dsin_022680 [Dipteronia sinensis]|uniref:Uncharacterized protein n=1 Tax=Dipteronia sinensis TaxID=43782 RepID=A0AAE0A2E2_9ROSI|nr:hypothetical protein Dsin_022680 [Dipteronia sinensis]